MTVLGANGYYSCEEKCDFDLCRSCVTCSVDGMLLYETYEIPSQADIRWQQFAVQTTSENYFETTTNPTTQNEYTSKDDTGLLSTPRLKMPPSSEE